MPYHFSYYMRIHTEGRDKYSELKKEQSLEYPYDREGYFNEKDSFIC
jgi:hypothetical protein